MRFQRLKLQGFKSFVDPAELLIDTGLTGVVGPNGCGKSNLVEALRWVMGETSARQMRGGEMDDVIFGGSSNRPARNIAEVVLTVDNSDRRAPAAFNDWDELGISRRIDRGKGSTYRVNGRESRARDVQLLFADAGTGAHSPSLVSQGRIAQVINAKPADRRAVLEDAAGVAGLQSRRNEAEQRLKAAETNLERLQDVLVTIDAQAVKLRVEAVRAAEYRQLSDAMRRTEARLFASRWATAVAKREEAAEKLEQAQAREADAEGSAAHAAAQQAEAAAALPPLRDAEARAAAALHHFKVEEAKLEAEGRRVADAARGVAQRRVQVEADMARERDGAADAEERLAEIAAERDELAEQALLEEEGLAEAAERLAEAEAAAQAAQEALDQATRAAAAEEARRDALERQIEELERRNVKLSDLVDAAEQRRAVLAAELDDAPAEDDDEAELAEAEMRLEEAQERRETAEEGRRLAVEQENAAGRARAAADAAAARLKGEADGVAASLKAPASGGGPPALDALTVTPGYEIALAAALEEDLSAPLAAVAPQAPRRWSEPAGAPAALPAACPPGTEPLAAQIQAPAALAARLSLIAVAADASQALGLIGALAPGWRVVSRDGAMARWDGFYRAPGAPSAAAARLELRNRLEALTLELEAAEERRGETQEAEQAARYARSAAESREREMRDAERAADQALRSLRDALAKRRGRLAQARAELTTAENDLARLLAECAENDAAATAAMEQLDALPSADQSKLLVAAARTGAAAARAVEQTARAERDRLKREGELRGKRLAALEKEARDWERRADRVDEIMADLRRRLEECQHEAETLAEIPERLAEQRETLIEAMESAEQSRRDAADALAAAESALAAADRAAKEAEGGAGSAREARLRAEALVEQTARDAVTLAQAMRERLDCRPDEIFALAETTPDAPPPSATKLQSDFEELSRRRDALGAVNLRAEEELNEAETQLATLTREREDLLTAIDKLRAAIAQLNKEGRERLLAAFEKVNAAFGELFGRLFGGGKAHLVLTEAEDPLAAGLEIMACPPGKKLQTLSLLSGGEQALTALSLIFAVFLSNPSPICVLDEVDAPLDDSNVDRFCSLLVEIADQTGTRFLVVTHHRLTMARMDRLYGVTMAERGVSQLVSVDLARAEALRHDKPGGRKTDLRQGALLV